jgi:hypothetical protein
MAKNRSADQTVLPCLGCDDATVEREAITLPWSACLPIEATPELPELMKPVGPGYMPHYCAAQWIASKGGTAQFDPWDESRWHTAYAQLHARISSDEVTVTGVASGTQQRICGLVFASVKVDSPFGEFNLKRIFSEELYLESSVFIDHEHWDNGLNDKLATRWGAKWTKILVLKSDIARWWPFSVEQAASSFRSGAPGRPSSMHLVRNEYFARRGRGEATCGIVRVSKELLMWLQETHPETPPLTAKTIMNNLRAEHRQRGTNARK